MKLLLVLVLLLPLSLFSLEIKNSENYDNGLQFYKLNQFDQSFEEFYSIYLENLSDARFNFYFGRSAYETGHYEIALAAFERVEMLSGPNIVNRLEMARTYFMLKMYEDAENAFTDVLSNPNIPETLRKNIELSLSRVSKVQKKSFTYSKIMIDALYDSNVNYGSLDDYQYGGNTWQKTTTKADIGLQAYANLTNIYDIGEKNGFALKNELLLYSKNYAEQTDYNILYMSYSPSLVYSERSYTAQISAIIDTTSLGKTHYLYTLSIAPYFQYNHSNTLTSILKFKYQAKDFIQEAQNDLDATHYEMTYGLQKILSPRSYLYANVTGVNETKIRGNNIYVNYNEYKIDTTYANQFTSMFAFDLYAQARLRKYSDYSRGFGSIRTDRAGSLNAGLTMVILPTLRVNLRTSYEYVDSNQDRFSYHKYTLSTGLIKTF